MGVGNKDFIHWRSRRDGMAVLIAVLVISGLCLAAAHGDSCGHSLHDHDHGHNHHHHQHHQCGGHHHYGHEDEDLHVGHGAFKKEEIRKMLPEELAEEEELKLYGFGGGDHHHDHHHHHDGAAGDAELSGIGKILLTWVSPMFVLISFEVYNCWHTIT